MNNAIVILETLLLGAAMLGALFYFGYGATQLFAPRALGPYFLLLIPFAGMALVIVWDYAALALNFDLTQATWALVIGAGILNLIAWRRTRHTTEIPSLRDQWRTTRWVFPFALIAFGAAVAPLWRYGYLTIIGENWDYEFYLPLADYLRVFPTALLATAPSNPLLNIILSRHILPLPMGFSYLQASLDTLLNLQALDTFAILLGVLRALGVGAAFLFFRAALKMSERAALVASAFVALNGLLLWFTYWNFGLHLTALALLPVALTLGINALQARSDGRSLVAAGLFLGALNVTYHPALVAAGLPLVVLGLYLLISNKTFEVSRDVIIAKTLKGPGRARTLRNGIAVILLTLLFSLPALWHIEDFRREYYGREPLAIGLRQFVPLSDGYGLSLNTLDLAVGHTIPTPWLYDAFARVWAIAAPALTLVAIALSLYALWKLRGDAERRAVWYSIVGASVLYILIFRLPFLRPYPYGFLKSLSLVAYILTAVAVQGGEAFLNSNFRPFHSVWDKFSLFRSARWIRFAVLGVGVAAGILVAATFALSLEQYFKPVPPFFNAEALQLRAAGNYLDRHPNADGQPPIVFLTDRAEAQKIPMGLAAYLLLGDALKGDVTTGYGAMDNALTGQVYDYALLLRGENPTARGYAPQSVWQNQMFALYPRQSDVAYQRAFDAATVAPQPLQFTIGATQIVSGTGTIASPDAPREASLSFATFIPQRVTLAFGNTAQDVALPPGLSTITLPAMNALTTVSITPHVDQAVLDSAAVAEVHLWMPFAQLHTTTNNAAVVLTPSPHTLLLTCPGQTAKALDVRCFVVNPDKTELTWRWIVRGTFQGTREERVISQQETKASPLHQIDIAATPSKGLNTLQFDENAPISFAAQTVPDGSYRGDLEIYNGDVLLARVELYRFQIQKNGANLILTSSQSGTLTIAQP